MNYKKGKPLARITYKGLDKVLKYDTKEPEIDVTSEESIERFGKKTPMLSLFERIMNLSDEDLSAVINADPTLKVRLKNEIKNGKVPDNFIPIKSKNPTVDGWDEMVDIPGARFTPTVDPKDFRDIIYIYGSSGSGKSVMCRSYIEEYRKEFPSNDVYLFSLKPTDVSLEDKHPIRIPNRLDILAALDVDTLKNSLVIFDDCDVVGPLSAEMKEVYRIQENILTIARDRRISCIITTHLACKGERTKTILNETTKIIAFPGRAPYRTFSYLMDSYGNISPKMARKIWDMRYKTRWVCVDRTNPSYVIYEEGCFTLT